MTEEGLRGFALVELLVALAIGLVLTAGIFQVFMGSTTSYALNDDLSRLQENGRYAMYLLRHEVRSAGYMGCVQDVDDLTNTLNNSSDFLYDYKNAVYGLEAVGSTWEDYDGTVNPTATTTDDLGITDPVEGSDILVIRGGNPGMAIEVTANMADSYSNLTITSGLGSSGTGDLDDLGGDILLVANCEAAAVFETNTYSNASGSTTRDTSKDLGHTFEAGAQVFPAQTVIYYVRNNADGHPALYRKVNEEAVEELVEGVANMQVLYGVDSDDDDAAEIYETADDVDDWMLVVSVRMGLLMQTVDEILKGPEDTDSYDIDGDGSDDFGPANDRRLRMVIGGTIGLRNRLH